MRRNKKTKAVTFSGLAIALIVVLLFIAGMVDILDYTVSAICGIVVTFILIEFGSKFAVSVFAGASLLALLVIPTKVSALLFVIFCGWYPFAKRQIEKVREPLGTVLKFITFNSALIIMFFISRLLIISEPISLIWYIPMWLVCNITFVLYDILITKLIWIYVHKYRSKLTIF